jgi:hypothetical protein
MVGQGIQNNEASSESRNTSAQMQQRADHMQRTL